MMANTGYVLSIGCLLLVICHYGTVLPWGQSAGTGTLD